MNGVVHVGGGGGGRASSAVSGSGVVVPNVRKVSATFYAVVKPKFGRRYNSALGHSAEYVDSIRVIGMFQKRPTKPDGVAVKLTLEFNEQAFMPLQPAATISIPDSMVLMSQVVDVEALDENDQAVAEHLAAKLRGE